MKRRTFISMLAVLPFVAKAKAVEPEPIISNDGITWTKINPEDKISDMVKKWDFVDDDLRDPSYWTERGKKAGLKFKQELHEKLVDIANEDLGLDCSKKINLTHDYSYNTV